MRIPGTKEHHPGSMLSEENEEAASAATIACARAREYCPSAVRLSSDLLVDADGAVKHRIGIAALVPDRLKHPRGQRIKFALNRVLRTQLRVLQQGDEQKRCGGERGSGGLLVGSAGADDVASKPGKHERYTEREERGRAREVGGTLRNKPTATIRFAACAWMLQGHPNGTVRRASIGNREVTRLGRRDELRDRHPSPAPHREAGELETNASRDELKRALREHRERTRQHVANLKQCFTLSAKMSTTRPVR